MATKDEDNADSPRMHLAAVGFVDEEAILSTLTITDRLDGALVMAKHSGMDIHTDPAELAELEILQKEEEDRLLKQSRTRDSVSDSGDSMPPAQAMLDEVIIEPGGDKSKEEPESKDKSKILSDKDKMLTASDKGEGGLAAATGLAGFGVTEEALVKASGDLGGASKLEVIMARRQVEHWERLAHEPPPMFSGSRF